MARSPPACRRRARAFAARAPDLGGRLEAPAAARRDGCASAPEPLRRRLARRRPARARPQDRRAAERARRRARPRRAPTQARTHGPHVECRRADAHGRSACRPARAATRAAHERRRAAPKGGSFKINRRRPTLPGPCGPSTIGAEGLNCSVRNGKRCFPLAIATGNRARPPSGGPSKLHSQPLPGIRKKYPSSPRPISTGLLHTLPRFQIRPINLVVYQGSYSLKGMGELISRPASRLDAFSGYPIRT